MKKRRAWTKKNGDFIAIALLSGMLTALIYVVAVGADWPRPAKPFNFGFSSQMDCEPLALGEPVCVRKR